MTGWNVGGVTLPDGPYLIGAGVCKTPAATAEWLKIAPVVSGSYTKKPRDGTPGKVLWPDTLAEVLEHGYALNSYGMPNIGFKAAAEQFAAMGQTEQPLIVSIAGFSVDEYLEGIRIFSALDNVSAIEINLGCPNTQGEHRDILSFNWPVVCDLVRRIAAGHLNRKPLWFKFSPYSNPAERERMAQLLNQYSWLIKIAVVVSNTFPNAYTGEGKINPDNGNHGMAALSGPVMKLITLGHVREFRRYLNSSIDVIGVGGIMKGDDVIDYLEAEATAVEMVTWPYFAGSPRSFQNQLFEESTSGRFRAYLAHNM